MAQIVSAMLRNDVVSKAPVEKIVFGSISLPASICQLPIHQFLYLKKGLMLLMGFSTSI